MAGRKKKSDTLLTSVRVTRIISFVKMHHLLNRFYLSFEILVPSPTILRHIRGFYVAFPRKFKLNNDPTSPVNKKKYRDLLIALLCASRQYFVVLPSHFCGL